MLLSLPLAAFAGTHIFLAGRGGGGKISELQKYHFEGGGDEETNNQASILLRTIAHFYKRCLIHTLVLPAIIL